MKDKDIFVCDNCGKKFSANTALSLEFNCDKCRDIICVYSTDSAELITQLQERVKAMENAVKRIRDIAPTGQGEDKGTLIWQLADGVLGEVTTALVAEDKGEL